MKKLIICLSLIFFPLFCFAEVYVLIDKTTKDVKGICENNTAQVEKGMKLIVLPSKWEDLKDYGFKDKQQYRRFVDNKFIEDTERINEESQKINAKKQDRQAGKANLKAGNPLTDDQIKALFE